MSTIPPLPVKNLLTGKYGFSYEIWRTDKKDIRPEHIAGLREEAEAHIIRMLDEGFTEGELFDTILVDDKDPVDGVEHRGNWRKI